MEGAYLFCGQALLITACFTDQLARLADIVVQNMYTKEFQASFILHRPLSRRLDRCDRVIQDESGDSNGGNV